MDHVVRLQISSRITCIVLGVGDADVIARACVVVVLGFYSMLQLLPKDVVACFI